MKFDKNQTHLKEDKMTNEEANTAAKNAINAFNAAMDEIETNGMTINVELKRLEKKEFDVKETMRFGVPLIKYIKTYE